MGGAWCLPAIEWDKVPIGDGTPGQVATRLNEILREDEISGEGQVLTVEFRSDFTPDE